MAMWIEHSASLEATVLRLVACEECDGEFVYELTVSATGQANSSIFYSGSAPKQARQQAKQEFKEGMKYGCRALPCPECAHYQDHMIGQAKWDKAGHLITWGAVIGIAVAVLGVFFLASTQMRAFGIPVVAVGVLVGGGVCGAGVFIHSTYDPNKLPEKERYKLAGDDAVPRAEFEAAIREKSAADYRKVCKKLDQGRDAAAAVAGQFFADPDQVYEESRLKAELPTGEPVRVQLKRKMKSGEEFEYEHDYNGRTVRFDYRLVVYTETKERK